MISLLSILFTIFFSLIQAQSNSSTTLSNSSSIKSSQTLLSVPAYPTASSAAYSNTTAKTLSKDLPGYTYNLTSERLATRIGICNQTTLFCSTSACSTPTANISTNFCNPTTMGYNCECNDGATSRLLQQPLAVPVNSYDCKFRSSACLSACQNTHQDSSSTTSSSTTGPIVSSIPACQNACNYILTSTCGTEAQIIPEYQVKKFDEVPKYYPDTSKGGVALGITASSAKKVFVSRKSMQWSLLLTGSIIFNL